MMTDERLAEIRFAWPAMSAIERTSAMKELADEVERTRKALAHVADEIKGQREYNRDPYWQQYSPRAYWAQLEGVARAALSTKER